MTDETKLFMIGGMLGLAAGIFISPLALSVFDNDEPEQTVSAPALHSYTVSTNAPATIVVMVDGPKAEAIESPGGSVKIDRARSVVVAVNTKAPKIAQCWIQDETAGRVGENIGPAAQQDGTFAMCRLYAGDSR